MHVPMKGNWIQVCPPTCITEAQLREGVARIDAAIAEALEDAA
jgi:4-aminobutyrate aminotransferase-like enzyme